MLSEGCMSERRKLANSELRILVNQVKAVEAMTDDEWLSQWILSTGSWIPKIMWLGYLKERIVEITKTLTLEDTKDVA
jgi:hypothetical protein